MSSHHLTGILGENTAAAYLSTLGYKIYGQNIRIGRYDEIDLLAFDPQDQCLVFVEVKSRSKTDKDFSPRSNFTRQKKMCLKRAMRRYVAEKEYDGGYRLDLLCVIGQRVVSHVIEVDLPGDF